MTKYYRSAQATKDPAEWLATVHTAGIDLQETPEDKDPTDMML